MEIYNIISKIIFKYSKERKKSKTLYLALTAIESNRIEIYMCYNKKNKYK